MRIRSIRTLHGPNVFHDKPILILTLELGALAEKDTAALPGFKERLVAALPGLHEHGCSLRRPGGFVERLERGTYLGHVVEHVAIAMSDLAGIGVTYGKTVSAGEPGVYEVAVRFVSEAGMRILLQGAVDVASALLAGEPTPLDDCVASAKRAAEREALGPSTRSIVEAAEARGIPTRRVGRGSLVQLGYGANLRWIQAALTSRTSSIAVEVACDKDLTKEFLRRALIPVPAGAVAESLEEARLAFRDLGGCAVVKPLDANQGKGISLDVRSEEELARAFELAREYSSDVIVEELFLGKDYRALVVSGTLVAASERVPAHVIGDGRSPVSELVRRANEDPLRGDDHEKPLTKIKLDAASKDCLARRGYSPDYVPRDLEVVFIRQTANLSTGGTARDVTREVHPAVKLLCERAAQVVGLDVCGIDLILPDISLPPTSGGVIEVNAAPGLRMHLHPAQGEPRAVGEAIVESLYPAGASARIPIASITGTNGKTTTARLVAHLAASLGKRVGLTTSTGVFVDGAEIAAGDTTGPRSAEGLLCDPTVELAVLETARGGIVRRGLGYDWADVAVLTNVTPDHLGQDGIEDLDDLRRVKSVVAERVHPGGTLVLNADCANVARIFESERVQKRLPREVVWYSLDARNERVREHRARGGAAYFLEEGWLVAARGSEESRVRRASEIPLTFSGTATYHVSNALGALAAARALGVSAEQAAWSLATFDGCRQNAGRSNLYRVNGGLVLIDYGHNPDALRAVTEMVGRWKARRTTGVVAAPGDRPDFLIEELGRIAARGFDRLIVKEDDDRRGRADGAIAALLERAIAAEVPSREQRTILDERAAAEHAFASVGPGEVVVFLYDSLANVLPALERLGATPVSDPSALLVPGFETRAA